MIFLIYYANFRFKIYQIIHIMFNSTYNILEELGRGKFGIVYKGENIHTKEEVAIKIEKKDTKLLKRESNIYMLLNKEEGFPRVKWYGSTNTFCYMVFDLLGLPLTELKIRSDHLDGIIIKRLGKKMFRLVEKVHSYQMLHRDIKPDNFLFDQTDFDKLYLVDFGLSKSYKTVGDSHIKEQKISDIIGTTSFVSLNVHNKILPSRRDDLESVVYILCYLFLPLEKWPKEESQMVEFKKILPTIIIDPLKEILEYVWTLSYEETPLYDKIITTLETI